MPEVAAANLPELPLATELAARLAKSGRCDLQYATAEMQPFSNAQRPDIVYTPTGGAFAGQTVFIEVKTSLKRSTIDHLEEHLSFAKEYIGSEILFYYFVTNMAVSDLLKHSLKKKRIHIVDKVKSADDVIDALNEIGL